MATPALFREPFIAFVRSMPKAIGVSVSPAPITDTSEKKVPDMFTIGVIVLSKVKSKGPDGALAKAIFAQKSRAPAGRARFFSRRLIIIMGTRRGENEGHLSGRQAFSHNKKTGAAQSRHGASETYSPGCATGLNSRRYELQKPTKQDPDWRSR